MLEERCVEIADQFLDNPREQGLIPKGVEFSFVDVQGDEVAIFNTSENTFEMQKLMCIWDLMRIENSKSGASTSLKGLK